MGQSNPSTQLDGGPARTPVKMGASRDFQYKIDLLPLRIWTWLPQRPKTVRISGPALLQPQSPTDSAFKSTKSHRTQTFFSIPKLVPCVRWNRAIRWCDEGKSTVRHRQFGLPREHTCTVEYKPTIANRCCEVTGDKNNRAPGPVLTRKRV